MRFLAFQLRNTDPNIPAKYILHPMVVDEPAVCNRQEEFDRIERLPLHWDHVPYWAEDDIALD
jgi:hypothetical protein